MAGETIITVVGNLTDDPELRFTPSGAAVANFRVASTPRTFNRQTSQWEDGEALVLNCSVWRQAAENVAESLQRGMRVVVEGRLRQRSFEAGAAERRTVTRLDADDAGPRRRSATPQVTKTARSGSSPGGGVGGGGTRQPANAPWATRPAAAPSGGDASGGGQPAGDPWSTGGS